MALVHSGVSFGSPLLSFIVGLLSLNHVMVWVSLCVARAILDDRSFVRGAIFTGATTVVLPSLAMET